MPNISVQLRRGTTTEHNTFTGAEGEVTVDTDLDTLRVHDGTTAGGVRLAKHSELAGAAGNTNLGVTHNAETVDVTSSTGDDITLDAAVASSGVTPGSAGVMTDGDKEKLDGIATGATANAGTVTSVDSGTGLTGGPITGSGSLSIAENGVTSTELQSDANVDGNRSVTTNHIKNAAVTNAKLANGSVQSAQISADAVGQAAMQNNSIGTNELIGNAVTFAKIQQIDNLRVIGNVSGNLDNTSAVEIKNENDLASDSATALATQASIKAYVDSQAGGGTPNWNSGWFNNPTGSPSGLTNGGTYTFTHNLGTTNLTATIWVADDASGTNAQEVRNYFHANASAEYGAVLTSISTTSTTLQLLQDGWIAINSSGVGPGLSISGGENWSGHYVKVVLSASATVGAVSKSDCGGWFNNTTGLQNGGTYTFTHNLGTKDINVTLWMATDSSGSNQREVNLTLRWTGSVNSEGGAQILNVSTTQLTVQLAEQGWLYLDSNGDWQNGNWGTTHTHIKVIAVG